MAAARKSVWKRYYSNTGFTLVEFLVVFVITAIIIAFAIPAFNNFNRGQSLKATAVELKSNLRQAQNKALSGEKACSPTDQSRMSLLGWYVRFDTPDLSYTIAHHCINSSTGNEDTIDYSPREYTMKGITSITFDPIDLAYILFSPVSKGIAFYKASDPVSFTTINLLTATSATITLTNADGNSYRVKVSSTGEITDEKVPQ